MVIHLLVTTLIIAFIVFVLICVAAGIDVATLPIPSKRAIAKKKWALFLEKFKHHRNRNQRNHNTCQVAKPLSTEFLFFRKNLRCVDQRAQNGNDKQVIEGLEINARPCQTNQDQKQHDSEAN